MQTDPLVFGPNTFEIAPGPRSVAFHYTMVKGHRKNLDFVSHKQASGEGYSAKIADYLERILAMGKQEYLLGVLVTPKIALRLYAEGTACPGKFEIHRESYPTRPLYTGRVNLPGHNLALLIQDNRTIMWPKNNGLWAVVNHALGPE